MVVRDYETPGPDEGPEPGSIWTLMFDGASNALGHEYEACILRLEAAIDLRIKLLEVYGDSALGRDQMADALATLSSMFKVTWLNYEPRITVRHFDEPAYCLTIEEQPDDKPWYHDIKRYLEKQEYPENASTIDKKTLRRLAAKFFLCGNVLYKRNYDSVLLRCVDKNETREIIK
ncbi:uncharacterized protein LOC131624541 [Vicia villosa]|uniref:uncharacterized protein LOC131624541 n=1 Tax=Vicia villosa TaxID=3911 RepID=UPI00273C299F|nr:uncharacterized protein LOC131624541 [Vicia villosa]